MAYATEFWGEYDLTLSREEAETLRVLVARVGGSREHSPRKHTKAIGDALDKVLNLDVQEIAENLGQIAEVQGNVMFYTNEDPLTRAYMELMIGTLA